MMPDWPLLGDGQRIEQIATGSNYIGSSANNAGSFHELVAATEFDAHALTVTLMNFADNGNALVDLAIGGSGSEVIIIPQMAISLQTNHPATFQWPVSIPAGSRVSVRIRHRASNGQVRVWAQLFGQGLRPSQPYQRVIAYGANTADSGGAEISIPDASDTFGSYAEITSATDTDHELWTFAVHVGGLFTHNNVRYDLEVAIGAASSEVTVYRAYMATDSSYDQIQPYVLGPVALSIPAGTRLSARMKKSATIARTMDIVAYGIG